MTFEEWYGLAKAAGYDIDAMGIGAYDAAKAAWHAGRGEDWSNPWGDVAPKEGDR